MLLPILLVAGSYLIGSIPFSWLIARRVTRSDLRTMGSGNVGATNVLRSAGKGAGVVALGLDLLKGWSAVAVARLTVAQPPWPWTVPIDGGVVESPTFWIGLAGLLAVAGHVFPVWLGFRGGKGVATATGVFVGLAPLATAIGLIVFLMTVAMTRYVSLGSMSAAAIMPLLVRFVTGGTLWTVVFAIAIALIVVLKHHTNIRRLLAGEERRFPR